jgi:hypothetical protein
MSASLNESFVCNQLVKDLAGNIQVCSPLRGRRCHSPTGEIDEAVEHLLILCQLLQELLVSPGETAVAPIHGVEFIDSFVPPRKQRELLQCQSALAVETSE